MSCSHVQLQELVKDEVKNLLIIWMTLQEINHAFFGAQAPRPKKSISFSTPLGYLKWNVDTSFNPFTSHSFIIGVLRDSDGNFVCLFSSQQGP